ncbi:rhodanese-like domain-containing protein [Lachnoclostridium edouardi]|uniref:rhodanese-like domain-containing protein n=1 Tax=Lachnoclostridium edouardi TaxID=1926283 RepID=UPI000C7A1CFF|nr:rhodanese-like domain-containing protein [Lachnoclostridium edouardi]
MMAYPTITMAYLDMWLERGENMQVIDLRNRESYMQGHFYGAINIPFEELEERIKELPINKILIFYCSRGSKSMLACNRLSRSGYQVVNVANGFHLYRGKYTATGL